MSALVAGVGEIRGADGPELRDEIREELLVAMRPGNQALEDDAAFSGLALRVFRYQARANPVYASYVRSLGMDPRGLTDWRAIPPVPASVFKELSMLTEDPRPVQAVFKTSGTTTGGTTRGTHRVRDLSLYRASLTTTSSRYIWPDLTVHPVDKTKTGIRVLCLTPSFVDCPESSLVYMLKTWCELWDDGGGGFLADRDGRISPGAFLDALKEARESRCRVLLSGTAFGFVHLLDETEGMSLPHLLPGSRIVETGGFKGRSRSVSRGELYGQMENAFGVPLHHIVNEYGMTELLSQFYEPVLVEEGPADPSLREHRGPPWTRSRVLHPQTLEPTPPGEPGLLCHLDLANLDSVAAILTEDLGVACKEGFKLLGRSEDAEPRGCSLALEDIVASAPPSSVVR